MGLWRCAICDSIERVVVTRNEPKSGSSEMATFFFFVLMVDDVSIACISRRRRRRAAQCIYRQRNGMAFAAANA